MHSFANRMDLPSVNGVIHLVLGTFILGCLVKIIYNNCSFMVCKAQLKLNISPINDRLHKTRETKDLVPGAMFF